MLENILTMIDDISMRQCRLTAAKPAPPPALSLIAGSFPAFPARMANDFRHTLRVCLKIPAGVMGLPYLTHHHPLSPSRHHRRPVLKNDRPVSPSNHAATTSLSGDFRHHAAPAFDPETSLKRLETTLKWLETRLKRLEINVETLKRFNQFKNSTSHYQRLTQIDPLKREKILKSRHENHPSARSATRFPICARLGRTPPQRGSSNPHLGIPSALQSSCRRLGGAGSILPEFPLAGPGEGL